MKKAVTLYQSKTGITKKFAEEITAYVAAKGIDTQVLPVSDNLNGLTENADYLFMGCWTAGLMLLFQHPDKVWKDFAQGLPGLSGKKVALFTTYKIATGSMFKSMKKHLNGKCDTISVELKSKKGNLSDDNKAVLDRFIEK